MPRDPVHPGEVLREDFLRPAGLSVNALAKALHVPTPRINDVVLERRGITADTALRLARYFGGDAQSWLNLQAMYDLRAEIANLKKIEREVLKRIDDFVKSHGQTRSGFMTNAALEAMRK